ncbi:MAG: glycosyltransferase family 2 protein [Planctomycetota bacterium]
MSHINHGTAPRVSIGLPVHNGEDYLEQAIDSLLAQSFRDFQLIISDNASTDRTEDICRWYAARDSRVMYHRLQTNRGATFNFNHVFRMSHGEYFKWAASDDVCAPNLVERCVEVLDTNPDVVWCHAQSAKIDGHGRMLGPDDPLAEGMAHTSAAGHPRSFYNSPKCHRRFAGVLLGTNWCADAYGLMRSDALRKTRLYPACFGSEKVLLAELALLGAYQEIPETLFFKRTHAKAASSLGSASAQAAFANPAAKSSVLRNRLHLLSAHLAAIRNVKMGPYQRFMCYWVLLRYLLQVHKWRRIFREAFRDTAIGALPRRQEQSS